MKDNYGQELTIGDQVFIFNGRFGTGEIIEMRTNIVRVKNNYTGDQYWYMGHDLCRVIDLKLSNSAPDDMSGLATYISEPALKEKPCEVCGKMNDIGVKGCWNCGSILI